MLHYIGKKFLDGQEQVLKEYNIGAEALGRAPEFDPKSDSIVRVEAHRLREKLKRYYETEGAGHPVIITLHVGHYVPQFVKRTEITQPAITTIVHEPLPDAVGSAGNGGLVSAQTIAPGLTPSDSAPATTSFTAGIPRRPPSRAISPNLIVGLGSVVIIALTVLILVRSMPPTGTALGPQQVKASGVASADDSASVRIIAGYTRKEYVDRMGKTWGPDRYFTGGEVPA